MSSPVDRLIGTSPSIRRLREFVPKVAASDCNVLITGETGTGKERVAEAIHESSPRARGNFVCINCAALPDSLLESELFGHEKGAFTGAHARFAGRLREADGGTVLLDEIGDMSPLSQAKILRAIEQKKIHRVGGSAPEPVDVRVIAATNQNLASLMANKQFRSDLYYRINVVNIELPPLRERREDVSLLFAHYMQQLSARASSVRPELASDALAVLMRYDWPGNVRELRNLVELLLVELPGRVIYSENLPAYMRSRDSAGAPSCERELLLAALSSTRWNKSQAAKQLQWSRMTLYRKLLKYGIVGSEVPPRLHSRHSK